MDARTSTPQRKNPENPPEYENIINNDRNYHNDNLSVCSDVSRATSRASRKRSKNKSVTIQANSGKTSSRYTEGALRVDVPDDDNSRRWPGETDTFATSECTRISNEDLGKFHADLEARLRFGKFLDPARISVIAIQLLAYLTPVIFLVLPKFVAEKENEQNRNDCDIGCEGGIIAIAVRLGILLIASVTLFWRKNKTKLPQINLYRATVNGLTFGITAVYWVFFAYKVIHWEDYTYAPIVAYASNYVDILLFLHYLACALMYFKSKRALYLLEVVRTTDGSHQFYNIGDVSIQEAAAWVLEKYYIDFNLYNPALQKSSKSRLKNMANFKVYDVDGPEGETKSDKSRAILAAAARRRDAGHNEKYYEEVERERRIRKRKARLTEAAEDAFSHVRRQLINDSNIPGSDAMDPRQTAETIFPSIARSMQKYLRTTRQNQHYTIEDIIDHLAFCIRHEMSSRSFLQRYVNPRPSASYPGQLMSSVDWSVNCDEPLISLLRPGIVFSLNQADYSLVVTCRTAPSVVLREEFIDPASHRFVIRMDSSETSV